jgi:tetraacyldisaccharide 4'-kinase
VPGAIAFGAAAALRRALFRRRVFKVVHIACPVIVVGNLTVGGTGKTPLVSWLVAEFTARGWRCGIVTRGFGGSESAPQLINGHSDPSAFGDEPVLLARRSQVPVAVGRDRPAAARLLIDARCNLIFSDDGLQHYALHRDFEIIVIDGDRLFGNGWLLPAGPLREPVSRLASANAVVINGGRPMIGGALAMRLIGERAVALVNGLERPLASFTGTRVHALAGIGNPERFFNMLRAHGIEVQGHVLDDHAQLAREAIAFADDAPVLMTQKDAIKCETSADSRHWYVPVEAEFSKADEQALLGRITAALEREPPLSQGAHIG